MIDTNEGFAWRRHSRATWLAALVAMVVMLVGTDARAGGALRIHRVTHEGTSLHVYHDPPQQPLGAGATVKVKTGRPACEVETASQLKSVRELKEHYEILLVLDRGGTETRGMGPYSKQILDAVETFLTEELDARRGDQFAIVDSSGSKETPRRQPLTEKLVELKAFLKGAKPPSGEGADIYQITTGGLTLLEKKTTKLSAAIVISDGVDPNPTGDAKPKTLAEEARKRGVPVYSIVVDRRGVPGADMARVQAGQGTLGKVSGDTGGGLGGGRDGQVAADAKLEEGLVAALRNVSQGLSAMQRTSCTLCGEAGKTGDLVVQMEIADGANVVTSVPSHEASNQIAIVTVPGVRECACTSDAQCASGQKCKQGACSGGDAPSSGDKSETPSVPPWAIAVAAGVAVVVLGLVLWARRRSQIREKAEALDREQKREEERKKEREEDRRREDERDERRRADEERRRADEERRRAEDAAAAVRGRAEPSAPSPKAKVLYRLRGDGAAGTHDLTEGTHTLGREAPSTVLVPLDTVSAQHAVLEISAGGRVTMTVLSKTNPTTVQGHRIDPGRSTELRAGDEIGLGRHVKLVLELAGAAAPDPARGSARLDK